jgi:ABC-2 type transport system ATP-binding protein
MLLEIKHINKSFTDKQVLHDVSFSVESNHTLGFLGRNGSGKTTTIRIIMSIISADSGEVLLDGMNLSRTNFKMGYLPEERGLYQKVPILEQMAYFGRLKGMTPGSAKKSALALLEKLDAAEYAEKPANTLSKGNQQKIQLAIALLNDPDILILDEPFSGLDPVNTKLLSDVIEENAKLAKVIFFSSHQLANVEEFCEDVCLIDKGRVILFGNLKEIKDLYPKDKLLIVSDQSGESRLMETLDTNEGVKKLILGYESDKNGITISLKESGGKDLLLHTLTDSQVNVPLHSFSVVAPRLLDIFLEKVGTSHEES